MTSRDEATQKYDPSENAENTLLLAKDLLERCQTLVDEVKQLQSFLISQRKENSIDVRAFQSHVNAELRSLEKVRLVLIDGSLAVPLTFWSSSIPLLIQPRSTLRTPFILPISHFTLHSGMQPRLREV